LVVQFDGIGFHVPFWKLPLLIVIFAFLSSPLSYFLRLRVRKRRGTRGELVLRLIQIRLATSSLERISPACQANSPRPRIADSSSTNAVSFSSARPTNRFPSPRCASAIQIVRPLESIADTQPQTPAGFPEIVSDDFPVLHRKHSWLCL